MALIDTTPEQIGDLVCKGISQDLEVLIRGKLMDMIAPTISALARDLAWNTAVNAQSYLGRDESRGFETRLVVNLQFNNEKVAYIETAGLDEGREIVKHPDGRTEIRKIRRSESGLT